jgi:putative transposase
MEEHCKEFRIQTMCRVFSVSRSGFYAWRKRPESQRKRDDKRFLVLIKTSFEKSRKTYGYCRIHNDFCELNESCGQYRIARLMRENNILPKTQRKFKVTTDSNHSKPIHENHLARQFNALSPNQRWTSDITYIPTTEGWLYLAVIMDLFSRKMIGWSMSHRMKEVLVIDALKMALFRRKINSNLLLHSDRVLTLESSFLKNKIPLLHLKCKFLNHNQSIFIQ